MSSANGDSAARLHSRPSSPTKPGRNGKCQAPALANDAERLSAIIATQQEIATAGLDLATVMSLVAQRTQALTGATGAAVVLAEGDELVYRAVSGTAAHSLGLRLKMDTSLSGVCVRTGRSHRCDDAETDERVDREACRTVGLRFMIVVPLLYDRRAVGVLKVLSPQPGAFSDRDVQTLQLMAGLIAAALGHAAAYEAKQALVEERTGALRQSEERFRGLMEQAPFSIQVFSPDGRTVRVNRAWEELWGTTLGQMAAYNVLHDPRLEAKGIAPYLRRAFAGEPVRIPAIQYDPNETIPGLTRHQDPRRWVSAVAYPLKDEAGKVLEVVLVHEDITARRRAEERLRLLWESAAVLLTTDQPDAMLRGLFTKLAPQFGLDAYFNYMVNDAGDALRLESCAGIPDETARSITRLGSGQAICGTVALHRQPVVATGILIGTLSFASRTRDQFDADELEFLRTITHYVTAAYERLRLIEQLRQADRRKDEFLAVLAHELRNPLAPVRNAVEVLRLRGVDDADLRWARDLIDRQVQQMTRLVDDLLDVSRITRGKVKLQKEPVDLAAVVARAAEISRPLIDARRHELTVTLPPEPVRLEADSTRLAQVVANLLNNAAKYTEERGHIGLTVERDGGEAVVRVRDSGVGIPAEMLTQVFDLFTQVTDSLDRSQGGLGIGLTLARSLVEMHGGSITAHSDGPGQGSEFIVRLPLLAERQSEASGPGESGRLIDSSARRILVVDDNGDAADSLAVLLRLAGHEVRTAHDGPAALAVTWEYRPDVVLLDLGLPRMSGYDVCRRLREGQFANGPLVVALTGYGQDEDRRRTREAGFDRHLVKPVNPDELRELLVEGHDSLNSPAFDPERAESGCRRSAPTLRAG